MVVKAINSHTCSCVSGLNPRDGIIMSIAHVQHVKIQLETIHITTRLWGYDIRICMVYTIKPCSDVNYFKLNFNISDVGY